MPERAMEETAAAVKRPMRSPEPAPHAPVRAPAPVWDGGGAHVPGAPSAVLAIQRAAGNQAVMRMLDASRLGHPLAAPATAVQRLSENELDDDDVQRSAAALHEPPDEAIRSAAAEGVSTPSTTLPHLDRIQASFGRHSIAHIQAHVGPEATRASRAMNALAYASGDHVVFGATPDLRTAAHEAAHIVQQQAGVQLSGGIGRAGDPYERHADAVADAVVAGRPAEGLLEPLAHLPVRGQRGRTSASESGFKRDSDLTNQSRLTNSRPAVSDASVIVQREIGKGAHNKWVQNRRTLRVYCAVRSKGNGYYELFTSEYVYAGSVHESDPHYELFTGKRFDSPRVPKFSIMADQEARRVYTEMPPVINASDFTWLHAQARGAQADFSYGDLSNALHSLLRESTKSKNEIIDAIRYGVGLPLKDGKIPLNPTLDTDWQLIASHILHYQNFHTPPNLKSKERQSENAWRKKELIRVKEILNELGEDALKLMLPKLPKNTQKATQLRNIYTGTIDISFPPDEESTLFKYVDNKAVYILNRRMHLDAFFDEQAVENEKKVKLERESSRKILTDSYLRTIAQQDDSVLKPQEVESYLKAVMGLKRSDSENSLDLTEADEKIEDISPEIFDPNDLLETAVRK